MDRTYLQWNVPNWITVFLMVTLGALVLNFASAFVQKKLAAE